MQTSCSPVHVVHAEAEHHEDDVPREEVAGPGGEAYHEVQHDAVHHAIHQYQRNLQATAKRKVPEIGLEEGLRPGILGVTNGYQHTPSVQAVIGTPRLPLTTDAAAAGTVLLQSCYMAGISTIICTSLWWIHAFTLLSARYMHSTAQLTVATAQPMECA